MSFEALDHETPAADLAALFDLGFEVAWKTRANLGRSAVALEVGTWAGRTALVLSGVFDSTFCVDHWLGNPNDRLGPLAKDYGPNRIFQTFARNMGDRFCRTVFPCCGHSRTWATAWTRPLDLVFIDGDHEYPEVASDIQNWRRHLRRGGLLCVHDYGVFEGVTRAVNELMPNSKFVGATIAYEEVK